MREASRHVFFFFLLKLNEIWHNSPILEEPSRRLVLRWVFRWLVGVFVKRGLSFAVVMDFETSTTLSTFWFAFLLVFVDFFTSALDTVLLLFFFSLRTGEVCLPTPHCRLLLLAALVFFVFLRFSGWALLTFLLLHASLVSPK